MLKRHSGILTKVENKKKKDIEDIEYFFAHTHGFLMNLVWHIEEVDALLMELIKTTPGKD